MAIKNIERRLKALERVATRKQDFPANSDDMIVWLESLAPEVRERVRTEARERARAWELETFGEVITTDVLLEGGYANSYTG